jgi:hypothetical protein
MIPKTWTWFHIHIYFSVTNIYYIMVIVYTHIHHITLLCILYRIKCFWRQTFIQITFFCCFYFAPLYVLHMSMVYAKVICWIFIYFSYFLTWNMHLHCLSCLVYELKLLFSTRMCLKTLHILNNLYDINFLWFISEFLGQVREKQTYK